MNTRHMNFVVKTHEVMGTPMVEAWQEGVFVAGIYGHQDGIRIVSKYLLGVEEDWSFPPAVVIKLPKRP